MVQFKMTSDSSTQQTFINSSFQIGKFQLNNRLIQGPLAGYSCAAFRRLFSHFMLPAFCVSEMLSAHDVIYKHALEGRYLYRAPEEGVLCYQISGTDPGLMAEAASKLASIGASLIDINCGCPKTKIRKKGAGSALLEKPELLAQIVKAVSSAINCPLTVKLRLSMNSEDLSLAQRIADAGADALIIHSRRWVDDYEIPCNLQQLALIKKNLNLPLIVNGDIKDSLSLNRTLSETGGDAFMISRAATGKPWLFQELLTNKEVVLGMEERIRLFMQHLFDLSVLENEHQALLQSRSLVRYYFKKELSAVGLQEFYTLKNFQSIAAFLRDKLVQA